MQLPEYLKRIGLSHALCKDTSSESNPSIFLLLLSLSNEGVIPNFNNNGYGVFNGGGEMFVEFECVDAFLSKLEFERLVMNWILSSFLSVTMIGLTISEISDFISEK